MRLLDSNKLREDFPTLHQKIDDRQIMYFDNACMSLKPTQVINAMNIYYYEYPGCHGRVSYRFGRKTTEKYIAAREKIQKFIKASSPEEIIFTRNATEGINLVANCLTIHEGEIIISSDIEHNSNLIPWQIITRKRGAIHSILKSNSDTMFNLERFKQEMSDRVTLVAIPHVSNVTGITNPLKEICKIAHDYNALVLVDGTQWTPHNKIDVSDLDIDFYTFSAHKMLGPTGMGCLFGKRHLLENMPQFLVGGETVSDSTYSTHTLMKIPEKFEAGLQNYAGAIGFAAAVDYLTECGLDNIQKHSNNLNKILSKAMLEHSRIKLIGPKNPELRSSIFNFYIEGLNSYDIAKLLDAAENIMVRAGKHCAHSWFNANNIPDSIRVSFYLYNTVEEVEFLIDNLKKIIKFF